jgi:hypothetical protein
VLVETVPERNVLLLKNASLIPALEEYAELNVLVTKPVVDQDTVISKLINVYLEEEKTKVVLKAPNAILTYALMENAK